MTDMTMMRVLGISREERWDKTVEHRTDIFVCCTEEAVLDVPGGRIVFWWENSAGALGYAHLRYEPIRAGLCRFQRDRAE